MKCSNCNAEMLDGAKFCNNCGSPISEPKQIICPNCGSNNDLGSKFCTECGNNLELKEENIICPNCNAEMPSNSKFCTECGCAFEKWQPSQTQQNDNKIESNLKTTNEEKTWWDEYKEERVKEFDSKSNWADRITEKQLDNRFTNKINKFSTSIMEKSGLIIPNTSSLSTKMLSKEYQDMFNTLSDDEKAVWNLKLGNNDLIFAIRKMDYDNQSKYLPILVKEVKEIANAPDYDYMSFYKKSSKGLMRTGVTTVANTWSVQAKLEREIEEYYNK